MDRQVDRQRIATQYGSHSTMTPLANGMGQPMALMTPAMIGTPSPGTSIANTPTAEMSGMSPIGIYTAIYSGVPVYETICRGVAVMKRQEDHYLNATQILKIAGVEKGRRTKILEKEILSGLHEKVQGGYGKYQGTW